MKIIVAGVHSYSLLAWSVSQALKRAGHEVKEFEYRNTYLKKIRVLGTSYPNAFMQKELLKLAKNYKPDILFICKGELIMPDTIEQIKKEFKIKIVNWFPDPRLFSYENVLKSIKHLDAFFTKNKEDIIRAKLAGLKNIYFLNHCADIELHKNPLKLIDDYFKDSVTIVGSYYPYRDVIISNLLDYNIKIWGNFWENSLIYKLKPSAIMKKQAMGKEQGSVFFSSSINLNTHHYDDMDAVNQRVFDISGSSGFQITDYKDAIFEIFKPGKEIESFKDIYELKDKINYYLKNQAIAKEIGTNAGIKTMSMHTYDHRIKEIFDIIKI